MNRSGGNAPCTGATQAGDPWRSNICVFSPARTAWLGSRVPETLAPGDQLVVMSCRLTTGSFSACLSSRAGRGSRRGERVDTRDGVDLIEMPVCRQQPLDAVGLHRRDVQGVSCRQPGMPHQQVERTGRLVFRHRQDLVADVCPAWYTVRASSGLLRAVW